MANSVDRRNQNNQSPQPHFYPREAANLYENPLRMVFAWVLMCFNSPVLFWKIKIKKKRKKDLRHPPQKKKNGRRGKFNVFNPLALLLLRARTDGCWYEGSSAKLMTARAATIIQCKIIHTNKACGRHHLRWAAESFPIDCIAYICPALAQIAPTEPGEREKRKKTLLQHGEEWLRTERRPK